MTYKMIHNALANKVQTQAICNCRITARAVIWSTSYFPIVSIFLLTALGGLPENPGTIESLIKIRLIYSVSYLNLGGLGALFGGLRAHQSPPWRWD